MERTARSMTEPLECVLQDLPRFLQRRPDLEGEGSQTEEMEHTTPSGEPGLRGIAGELTVSRFLVAIVGVIKAYQDFSPSGTTHGSAQHDDNCTWNVEGQEADVTPEVGQVLHACNGARGLAGDASFPFCGWCESMYHTGPNIFLPQHLYT